MPPIIPISRQFDQSTLEQMRDADPVVSRFALFDWSAIDPPRKRGPGSPAHPKSASLKKELIWGYGSGVAAATDPVSGDVALAEFNLPFNQRRVTYYRPLFQRAVVALHQFPPHVKADAAHDCGNGFTKAAHQQG